MQACAPPFIIVHFPACALLGNYEVSEFLETGALPHNAWPLHPCNHVAHLASVTLARSGGPLGHSLELCNK